VHCSIRLIVPSARIKLIPFLVVACLLAVPSSALSAQRVTTKHTRDGGTLLQVQEVRSGGPRGGEPFRSYSPTRGRKSKSDLSAQAAWHWGHWHKAVRHSRKRTRRMIRQLKDGSDGLAILAILGIRAPPVAIVAGIGSIGYRRIADAMERALKKARKNPAIRVDVGFRCYNVPYSPDPCYPWMQIRPRR